MKKYLTVGYAYPIYFLIILGQYFLAEGLDALYNSAADSPAVAQPVQKLSDAQVTTTGSEKGEKFPLTSAGRATGQGGW
jgi:hypothetical protein